ncbi:MAG: Acetolactate synthase large subunit (EC [uncultured Sulfurovum sp.]|uniref:Acetolactate synthase large subunit (EC) n=1 Tax=uncultured Sulfurovum sp. TaxID=269237 RepID=A0A6S6SN65_9BACT|nr:MAG: Acetolactate synthase large subunit (EC [uncultured Sulfurovum sp.]
MKVSDYIINILVKNKIKKVFGYIGGNNAHLMDSIDNNSEMEMVNTVHEQGAGFAAEGYARATESLGAATATSGPGATNLVTPIASCFFDSIPTIFLTGQVNTYECKYDLPIRQVGFQETDIVSVVQAITKYAVFVDKIENIRYELEKACFIAQEGRKGPVLVDIPIDLQYKEIDLEKTASFYDSEEYEAFVMKEPKVVNATVQKIGQVITKAKKPLILVGGGARNANIKEELLEFLNKTNIPVVSSLMGKDTINDDYQYNLGFMGVYGVKHAQRCLEECDVLLILGARLDARQTGRNVKGFAANAQVIHVDIDEHELAFRIETDIVLHADLKAFMSALNQVPITVNIGTWQEDVLGYKKEFPYADKGVLEGYPHHKILQMLSKNLKDDDIICVDVGLHQMWSAQSLILKGNQRLIFSGGLGSMGFALAAGIGATIGTGRRVITISGDGGFQMNLQELEVLSRRNLPIKNFILNNSMLGMVNQMQREFLNENYIGTKKDYSAPDFRNIARSYKMRGYEVAGLPLIEKTIKLSLDNNEPEIVNIQLHKENTNIVLTEPYDDVSDKVEVDFTLIDKKETMVILAFGQANAGNSAEGEYVPVENVYNIFNNKCYKAKDPLLGATATVPSHRGSVWTRLADKIIESGKYKNVIIKSIAVAGVPISCWEEHGTGIGWAGAMHGSYYPRIREAKKELDAMGFDISHVLIHQGESDTQNKTSKESYKKSFLNMLESMKRDGISAPIYLALASRFNFLTSKEVILAQKELISENNLLFEGPNTDNIDRFEDRVEGGSHFTQSGVIKHAQLWLDKLK